METIKSILKYILRLWPLLLVIIAGVFLFSGVGFMVALNRLSMFAFILLVFHLIRKSLFPYIDLEKFANKASEEPLSAAIVFTMMIIFIISLCYISVANAMTYNQILDQAKPQLPIFKSVVTQYWPEAPNQQYFPGDVEQETCASLALCWNPNAQLKTSREYGFGLGQITIAYGKKGNVRFNNFKEAKNKYDQLSQWQWDDRFNPKFQFTYIVLEMKNLFTPMVPYFRDDINRWAAALVSYNAGAQTVIDRMTLCGITKGCNKSLWFNGLETVHLPYEKKLLYGKALFERRNEYPHNVINIRSPKYVPYWDSIAAGGSPAQTPQQPASPLATATTTQISTPAPTLPSFLNPTNSASPTLAQMIYASLVSLFQYLYQLFNGA